jgi:hypothetical protein
MAERPGIFPTFFLSGFECSTFRWKDRGRRDLVAETQHRARVEEDYALLRRLGIAVAREGIPWPLVPRGGRYDFSPIDPMIAAMNRCRILPIWDLFHYGYPDELDPFAEDFAEQFARYCRAAAEYVVPRVRGPHFFTPVNEITFFAFAGGEWGWVAPFGTTREERFRFRLALCRAAIAGARAIREVAPEARMVNIDPLVRVVPPRDRPDLAAAAQRESDDDMFLAWDILAGRCAGAPGHRGDEQLFLRADGVPRARTARGAAARRRPHRAALRPAARRLGAVPPADDHRRDQRVERGPPGVVERPDGGVAGRR